MITVDESWKDFFEQTKREEYFQKIWKTLKEETLSGHVFYPDPDNVFASFRETSLEDLRVVILGQDPYHGPGQADGLCFSVPDKIPFPPSLKNIFRELANDLATESFPKSGSLVSWSRQGVLLLNTVLTVRKSSPMSHRGIGWEIFVDHVLDLVWKLPRPIAFILWGRHASNIMAPKEKIPIVYPRQMIRSAHPSPFSAHSGFLGSRPFSKANAFLGQHNSKTIQWDSIFSK